MPYQNLDELPDNVKAMPKGAQSIFLAAFNSAWDTYEDSEDRESKSFAIAFSAVKRKYHKVGEEWVEKAGLIETVVNAVKGAFSIQDAEEAVKGGTGSGNFAHAGIPGQVGGSAPGGGGGGGNIAAQIAEHTQRERRQEENVKALHVGSRVEFYREHPMTRKLSLVRGRIAAIEDAESGPEAKAVRVQTDEGMTVWLNTAANTWRKEGDTDWHRAVKSASPRELSALYAVTPKKLEGLTDEHLQMVHDRVVVLKGSPTVNDVHIEGYGEFDDEALERAYKAVLAELKRRGFDVGEVEKSDKSDNLTSEAAFIQKDAKRQIVYGVVYEPNIVDIQKDWASAEEIEQACHKFMKAYRKMGIRHDGAVRDTITPVESYIAPCDFQLGEQSVMKGSWVLAAHVESADTWKDVEENRLTGFSLYGKAKRKRGSVPA